MCSAPAFDPPPYHQYEVESEGIGLETGQGGGGVGGRRTTDLSPDWLGERRGKKERLTTTELF